MFPRWKSGDPVLLKLEVPTRGSDVALEMKSGSLLLRSLKRTSKDTLTVLQLNPVRTATISGAT
jgi:phage repressor protein C with HTH and peptisase S24 domain